MEKKLSQQEKALVYLFKHFRAYHFFPKTSDIQAQLNLSTVNYANRLRSELLKKDWICREPSGNLSFTKIGFYKLRSLIPYTDMDERDLDEIESINLDEITLNDSKTVVIMRSDIPIIGEVVAGTDKKPEDLVVDIGEEVDTLSIPDTQLSDQVFALRVTGKSMMHENIFPGDYLIVVKISADQISKNDLIVVNYLSEDKCKERNLENFELAIEDPSNFMGPTVKYYDEIYKHQRQGNQVTSMKFIRLSWRTQADESPHRILTRAIDKNQIYRVTGIYRSFGITKQSFK